MSSQIPLRSLRIPALQRQCLFLRHHTLVRSTQPSVTHPPSRRTFSSTPSRPAKRRQLGQDKAQTKAAAESQISPSPSVNFDRAQRDEDAMVDDIGLLQNTIVRAPLRDLLQEADGMKGLMSYYWNLIKHKGTALYSRYYYRACVQKSGWTKYLPIDPLNNTQYKVLAKRHYEQIHKCFASGNVTPLEKTCLPPLVTNLKQRIARRGNNLDMAWRLHDFTSTRVVSHRAAPLGDEQGDSAYRQVVVRIESVQSLKRCISSSKSPVSSRATTTTTTHLPWLPDAVRQRAETTRRRKQKLEDEGGGEIENQIVESGGGGGDDDEAFFDNGVRKTVVEYLVLQKRVIRGVEEEEWRVWGFTGESTPGVVARDERYWAKMLDTQVGPA